MNKKEILNLINNKDNWKSCPVSSMDNCDYVWYKQYKEVRPSCYCNDKGVQISLKLWDSSKYTGNYHNNLSFQLELCAETKDKVWTKLILYTLTVDNIQQDLDYYCNKLIKVWQEIN